MQSIGSINGISCSDMFTSKLLLFLVLASCALFAFGRSIPRGGTELDHSSNEGFRNDGDATSIWKSDDGGYWQVSLIYV